MGKIQEKINFGGESLESLIDEIIKDKIKEVTIKLKNIEENFPSANMDKKVDELK